MRIITYALMMFLCVCFQVSWSQTVEITGTINSENDVENIHVINKTEQKFTITNVNGAFKISAKLNDTLVVSSIQNKLKTIIVNQDVILTQSISISLEEQINTLDEVVIGKVLSGDLLQDMNHVVGKPITAKSLGIPSYQGKPLMQSERLVNEATSGFGIAPIINAISGRTKKLKNRVKLEKQEELMYAVKTRLSQDLFSENPLEQDLIMDFFYFCADDPDFTKRCKSTSDLEILVYLEEKLDQYKSNLVQHEN